MGNPRVWGLGPCFAKESAHSVKHLPGKSKCLCDLHLDPFRHSRHSDPAWPDRTSPAAQGSRARWPRGAGPSVRGMWAAPSERPSSGSSWPWTSSRTAHSDRSGVCGGCGGVCVTDFGLQLRAVTPRSYRGRLLTRMGLERRAEHFQTLDSRNPPESPRGFEIQDSRRLSCSLLGVSLRARRPPTPGCHPSDYALFQNTLGRQRSIHLAPGWHWEEVSRLGGFRCPTSITAF